MKAKMKTMSKKTNPELPAIPELTREQLNRLLCADYLEYCAKMIRKGSLTGFDIAWNTSYEKPVGKLEIVSFELTAPLEANILRQIEEAKAAAAERAAKQIPVVDATEHEKCTNEACVVCNSPFKA